MTDSRKAKKKQAATGPDLPAAPAPPPPEEVVGPEEAAGLPADGWPPDEKQWETLKTRARERDEYLALLQRVQANFDNYQKRIARDKEQWRSFAAENLIRDLLSPLDHLQRALKNLGDAPGHLREGIEIIEREFLRVLKKAEVEPLQVVGKPFNPVFHEAVREVESAEHPEGTVLAELRKGYMIAGKLLRPAEVAVSRSPAAAKPEGVPNPDPAPEGNGCK